MDGSARISTPGVITRAQLSPCSRLKTEIALEVIPRLSGNLLIMVSFSLIARPYCSTSHANVHSLIKGQERRYIVERIMDLDLVTMS